MCPLRRVRRFMTIRLHVADQVFDRFGEGERGVLHLYETFTGPLGVVHRGDHNLHDSHEAVT